MCFLSDQTSSIHQTLHVNPDSLLGRKSSWVLLLTVLRLVGEAEEGTAALSIEPRPQPPLLLTDNRTHQKHPKPGPLLN